ncbi:protein NRT1/ PTR FAMILY 3.1-like [Carex rostrata]
MDPEGKENKEKQRKQGGFKTMPFILANEMCDRFATTGFNANMITYLTQNMHMPLVEASNTLTNLKGTTSLTPLVGALIADSFAGRFWTIVAGSIIYQLGTISLTISAVFPSLHPPQCNPHQTCQKASEWQLFIFYASLLFIAIGSGGIRPCVVPFGADQFCLNGTQATGRRGFNFFNLYFFSMGLAVLLALTLVVYVQDNLGWGWGFGIPTMAFFFSVIAFMVGKPFYIKIKPSGSPLTRLAQVVIAAFKKRNVVRPDDLNMLYQDKELDADISVDGRLLHTNQLQFLDRAAIVTEGDMLPSGRPNLWCLSTVHRVEELKSIIRILPIWAVGILLFTTRSHNQSFAIQQAHIMDRHMSRHFQIPAATLSIFTNLCMLISLAIYDRLFVPLVRRFTKRPSGITYFQRMCFGLCISIMSGVSAALVERKRRNAMNLHGVSISVFWLVPQFAIHGIDETFMEVGYMEFFYDQSPESMRSTATALFWLASSMGNFLSTALVSAVQNYTKNKGDWLQDDLNKARLDKYYWLVVGLQMINFGYYILCARFYNMKPLEVIEDDKGIEGSTIAKEEVELGSATKTEGNLV